ncbi:MULTISPECIES: TetR/AcrR family transcriptional regulator [unclassified Arthrobacter]|uniref:TetR/AcrR family transcriptional regulator n=1 Tax=unclassified Pseudarthrobacter TaxID=2647000 RepID=UPI0033919BD4
MAAIAAEAGVSVETVYKAFGGKTGLVRALYDRNLAGAGSRPCVQALRCHAGTRDPPEDGHAGVGPSHCRGSFPDHAEQCDSHGSLFRWP